MNGLEFRKAMAVLREIWVSGNNYIAKTEPWKVVKVDREYAGTILRTAFNLIRLFAQLSAPIMPETAVKMLAIIGEPDVFTWPTEKASFYLNGIPGDRSFMVTEPLFQKIPSERIDALKVKYKETEA
jgi:methionyl-tRNA synthetase